MMKNDYTRNFFWIQKNLETNENKYYLRPMGKLIEVDKDVFKVCYNSYKKQYRDNKRDYEIGLVSLDETLQNGLTFIDVLSDDSQYANDYLYQNNKIISILNEIDKLKDSDKELIVNLLVKEKTEKELAEQLHMTQQGINYRKNLILKKLRKKIKNDL